MNYRQEISECTNQINSIRQRVEPLSFNKEYAGGTLMITSNTAIYGCVSILPSYTPSPYATTNGPGTFIDSGSVNTEYMYVGELRAEDVYIKNLILEGDKYKNGLAPMLRVNGSLGFNTDTTFPTGNKLILFSSTSLDKGLSYNPDKKSLHIHSAGRYLIDATIVCKEAIKGAIFYMRVGKYDDGFRHAVISFPPSDVALSSTGSTVIRSEIDTMIRFFCECDSDTVVDWTNTRFNITKLQTF